MNESHIDASKLEALAGQLRTEQTKSQVLISRVQSLAEDLLAIQQRTADFGSQLGNARAERDVFERDLQVERERREFVEIELHQTLARAEAAEAALGELRNSRLFRFGGPVARFYGRALQITRRK